MKTGSGQIGNDAASASDSGWATVRGDESIQYTPLDRVEQAKPPEWLQNFLEWLGSVFEPVARLFGSSWFMVKWVLLAAIVVLLLYLLWKLLAPVLDLGPSKAAAAEDEWIPAEREALALLDEADRLAAGGHYDAATHLLLKRSVGQIAEARPDWVEPSSTARELATLPALPVAARTAFGTIADRVERSLFALKRLGAEDWQAARAAYAEFALQRLTGDTR